MIYTWITPLELDYVEHIIQINTIEQLEFRVNGDISVCENCFTLDEYNFMRVR